jgi:hypothetical protein
MRATAYDRLSRTKPQLDIPFKNPPEEGITEIEVTDPTHPLFGQHFPVRSMGTPERGAIHVLVVYRDYMTLRIPLAATNLTAPRPALPTKLTLDAVLALVTLAEQCEALCPPHPLMSGSDCRPNSGSLSATDSHPSSTR